MSPVYKYPRPSVTVDVIVIAIHASTPHILLIRRGHPPFAGTWALPGGFLDMDEDLPAGARRELLEETGAKVGRMVQVGAYGAVDRDPRGRTVAVAYLAIPLSCRMRAVAGDDASDLRWFPIRRLPKMAFDHRRIIRDGLQRCAELIGLDHGILKLLPRRFSLDDLTALYAGILREPQQKSRLRRRLANRKLIRTSGHQTRHGKELLERCPR